MKNLFVGFLCVLFMISTLSGQTLKPIITSPGDEANTDSTCLDIPPLAYTPTFQDVGYSIGDTVNDFTLFTISGDSVSLSQQLANGKPILIISGSITCPNFRNSISFINFLYANYINDIEIYVVYTLEAHPEIDPSPYVGYEWELIQNQVANIDYRQAQTYGERKTVAQDMINDYSIQFPVLVDEPCNSFWETYGPAPNNAYLIDTNGIVFNKHGWFHRFPHNVITDLDSIRGIPTNNFGDPALGIFSYDQLNQNLFYGQSRRPEVSFGQILNFSSNPVIVKVNRLVNDLPLGWESTVCIDVCLGSQVDSTELLLFPGQVQDVLVYMYSDVPIVSQDTGFVTIMISNKLNPANVDFLRFFLVTSPVSGILDAHPIKMDQIVYPNPANTSSPLSFTLGNEIGKKSPLEFRVFSTAGQLIWYKNIESRSLNFSLPSSVKSGMYIIQIADLENGKIYTDKLIVR